MYHPSSQAPGGFVDPVLEEEKLDCHCRQLCGRERNFTGEQRTTVGPGLWLINATTGKSGIADTRPGSPLAGVGKLRSLARPSFMTAPWLARRCGQVSSAARASNPLWSTLERKCQKQKILNASRAPGVRHHPQAGGLMSGAASKAVAQVAQLSPGSVGFCQKFYEERHERL